MARDAAHQPKWCKVLWEILAVKASAQPKPPARQHRQQPRLDVERRQGSAESAGVAPAEWRRQAGRQEQELEADRQD